MCLSSTRFLMSLSSRLWLLDERTFSLDLERDEAEGRLWWSVEDDDDDDESEEDDDEDEDDENDDDDDEESSDSDDESSDDSSREDESDNDGLERFFSFLVFDDFLDCFVDDGSTTCE